MPYESEIERELRWAKEALDIVQRQDSPAAYAEGKDILLANQIVAAGYPELAKMSKRELEKHIERLERDAISQGKDPLHGHR